MKPGQVAAELIHIATKLQSSRNPDRAKVAAALENVVNKIAVYDELSGSDIFFRSEKISDYINSTFGSDEWYDKAVYSFDWEWHNLSLEELGNIFHKLSKLGNKFYVAGYDDSTYIFTGNSEEDVIKEIEGESLEE